MLPFPVKFPTTMMMIMTLLRGQHDQTQATAASSARAPPVRTTSTTFQEELSTANESRNGSEELNEKMHSSSTKCKIIPFDDPASRTLSADVVFEGTILAHTYLKTIVIPTQMSKEYTGQQTLPASSYSIDTEKHTSKEHFVTKSTHSTNDLQNWSANEPLPTDSATEYKLREVKFSVDFLFKGVLPKRPRKAAIASVFNGKNIVERDIDSLQNSASFQTGSNLRRRTREIDETAQEGWTHNIAAAFQTSSFEDYKYSSSRDANIQKSTHDGATPDFTEGVSVRVNGTSFVTSADHLSFVQRHRHRHNRHRHGSNINRTLRSTLPQIPLSLDELSPFFNIESVPNQSDRKKARRDKPPLLTISNQAISENDEYVETTPRMDSTYALIGIKQSADTDVHGALRYQGQERTNRSSSNKKEQAKDSSRTKPRMEPLLVSEDYLTGSIAEGNSRQLEKAGRGSRRSAGDYNAVIVTNRIEGCLREAGGGPLQVGVRYFVWLKGKVIREEDGKAVFWTLGPPAVVTNSSRSTILKFSCAKCTGARPLASLPPIDHVEVISGQTLKVKCHVTGQPRPRITWFKNDRRVDQSKRVQYIHDGMRLSIRHADHTDAGLYRCHASNILGSANSSLLKVTVQHVSFPAVELCRFTEYCQHDGTCYFHKATEVMFCQCPSGYSGLRCHERGPDFRETKPSGAPTILFLDVVIIACLVIAAAMLLILVLIAHQVRKHGVSSRRPTFAAAEHPNIAAKSCHQETQYEAINTASVVVGEDPPAANGDVAHRSQSPDFHSPQESRGNFDIITNESTAQPVNMASRTAATESAGQRQALMEKRQSKRCKNNNNVLVMPQLLVTIVNNEAPRLTCVSRDVNSGSCARSSSCDNINVQQQLLTASSYNSRCRLAAVSITPETAVLLMRDIYRDPIFEVADGPSTGVTPTGLAGAVIKSRNSSTLLPDDNAQNGPDFISAKSDVIETAAMFVDDLAIDNCSTSRIETEVEIHLPNSWTCVTLPTQNSNNDVYLNNTSGYIHLNKTRTLYRSRTEDLITRNVNKELTQRDEQRQNCVQEFLIRNKLQPGVDESQVYIKHSLGRGISKDLIIRKEKTTQSIDSLKNVSEEDCRLLRLTFCGETSDNTNLCNHLKTSSNNVTEPLDNVTSDNQFHCDSVKSCGHYASFNNCGCSDSDRLENASSVQRDDNYNSPTSNVKSSLS